MPDMKLVVCEKPSVAKSIAAVLGAKKREDGYLFGGGYIVSWCLGHLAELADADAYDEKYSKWRQEDLPILPAVWQYTVARDKKKQLDILSTLMNRSDVTEVINACDAGREGELIFRTVYNLNKCNKSMVAQAKSEKSMFITAGEVSEIMGVSKAYAYRVIKRLNDELSQKGFLVVQGKTSKKYFNERIYGEVNYGRISE